MAVICLWQYYTYIDYLIKNNKLDDHVFSLCLHEEGGVLSLGGIDTGNESLEFLFIECLFFIL